MIQSNKDLLIKYPKIFFLLVVLLLSPFSNALTYTLEMTELELQARVDAMMPLKKKNMLMSLVVTNPKVSLLTETNQLSIFANIAVTTLGNFKGAGKGNIVGEISYDKQQGVFYFINPEIKDITVDNVPAKYAPKIKDISQILITQAMAKYPVYTLKDNDMKQKLAKSLLQSVHVENGKIIATLKMF